MKRRDHIRSIYNQSILNDILISLASEELTEEELMEKLRQVQEERTKLEEEQVELFEEQTLPEEEEPPEEAQEPEETPEEEPEDDIPEDEKLEMPGQLEKGQTSWVETETGLGALKKYSPNATLAKTCPVCGFNNRPIYLEECQNCEKVYRKIKRFIDTKRREDKKYTPDMAFEELAKRYKYLVPKDLKKIHFTGGKTKLPEVNEIESTPRKQLEDMIWYRLNVKKDPKTGEPASDKRGMPIPLDDRKYFSTEEITNIMHLSPEKLREMVANYNSNIIENLPEEAKKLIKKDQNGEIIPSSVRQLDRYGYVAPAVVMGTGMADVKRRVSPGQEEKLSPEQVEGLKGPAFKSVDLAAWHWDKLKPVFGWDEKTEEYTDGWMKFLREKFLPALAEDDAKRKIEALQRVINSFQERADAQEAEADAEWEDLPMGLKLHTYFHYNPDVESIDDFENKHVDDFNEYKKEYKTLVVPKRKIDNKIMHEINDLEKTIEDLATPDAIKSVSEKRLKALKDVQISLMNYDDRKESLSQEEKDIIVDGISRTLKVKPGVVERHLQIRDDANGLLLDKPQEIEFMEYLHNRPNITIDQLRKKYERRRERFEKLNYSKRLELAQQFKNKAEKLKEKLPELEIALEEAKLSKPFDLAEEVKKYHQRERGIEDPDPQVEKELQEAQEKIDKERPKPTMPSPSEIAQKTKKSNRLVYITKLAVGGQLGLFGPKPNNEEEKEEEIKLPSEEAWRVKRDLPKKQEPEEETFEEEDEELPEPELDQEEKAEEAPIEDFGKKKGKYFIYFEWSPDYKHQPNSYKSFFSHTPERRTVDFEELLKFKIEKRFVPKIIHLMSGDKPLTTKKDIYATVIEPFTERRRRFRATVNRETNKLSWYGTDKIIERKEKERRLNLEKHKELKTEINLGITSMDELELVGDDDLQVIEKPEKSLLEESEKKRQLDIKKMKERRQKAKEEREQRLKELEKLTPAQKEKIEEEKEEARTKFTLPEKEYFEPSGKQSPEAPIKKVVTTRDFTVMKKKVKDPITKEITEKLIRIPKVDSFLISIRMDSKGNPAYASCEKITLQKRRTGPLTEKKPAFEGIYSTVTNFIDQKQPNLKGGERRELINNMYERFIKEKKGEDVDPYKLVGQEEFYLPEYQEDISTKPHKECPASIAPFKGACPQIKAALDNIKGEETPGFEIQDWDSIPRTPSRETSKERDERYKGKTSPEYHS